MDDEKYISSNEAAELLGVTIATISNWIKAGYLEAHKVGPGKNSHWRILRESVEDKIPQPEPNK